MGNSAQQHRGAIGCFAGRLASKSWILSPKTRSRAMKDRLLYQSALEELRSEIVSWWLITLTMLATMMISLAVRVMTTLFLAQLLMVGIELVLTDPIKSGTTYRAITENNSDQHDIIPSQVTRMLLLVAGDVELNPGPGSSSQETEETVVDSLTLALAVLVGQAPSSDVKLVLAAWAPDKTSIAEDLNKFKVPALKQALAWLWNRDISDKVVSRKNKAEVIQLQLKSYYLTHAQCVI